VRDPDRFKESGGAYDVILKLSKVGRIPSDGRNLRGSRFVKYQGGK